MNLLVLLPALVALTAAQPHIETVCTDVDGCGMMLAASGPVTVARLDKGGNIVGAAEAVALKSQLDAALTAIGDLNDERDTDKVIIDAQNKTIAALQKDLARVEGLLGGFDVRFGGADDAIADVMDATDTFKDSIGAIVDTKFKAQDKKLLSKADARGTYAVSATTKTQIAQIGQRLSALQALVEKSSGEKLPTCPDPKDPTNGTVEHQQPGAGGDHPIVPFIPGVTIHYSCGIGFGIKGATPGDADERAYERVCYADGTWASVLDKGKMIEPAECEKCAAAGYSIVDHTEFYMNVVNARWGGRDLRSGNPGGTSYWNVGPLSVSGLKGVKFAYEYVAGYSWNCGWAKGGSYKDCSEDDALFTRYKDGAQMQIWVVNADNDKQMSLVYDAGKLIDYPYDNCCARDVAGKFINGCWGETATKKDGCYSPPVKVQSILDADTGAWVVTEGSEGLPGPVEAKTRKETLEAAEGGVEWLNTAVAVTFQFKFINNARNMHLNPHHLNLEVLGEVYDPVNKACLG